MILIDQILGLTSTVLDKIFPDKDEREKAKIKLIELQQAGELKDLELRMSVMMEEAKSNDPWTSRARPSFMYVIYLMILASIPMGAISAFDPDLATRVADGMQSWLSSIPDGLWATFGIGYTGYAISRSVDKRNLKKNV